MPDERTELEKRNILRLSNEESNRITRECIQTAFINMLSERELDQISVSEIVKKAGVSRTAFYRNYVSKEDILTVFSQELLRDINRLGWQAVTEGDQAIIYREVFSRIKGDSKHFDLLMKAGFMDRGLLDFRGFLQSQYAVRDTQIRRLLFGWTGMINNIILDWYLDGMQESVDAMSELCCAASESIVARIRSIDPAFSQTEGAPVPC